MPGPAAISRLSAGLAATVGRMKGATTAVTPSPISRRWRRAAGAGKRDPSTVERWSAAFNLRLLIKR
jgi:hypothetical protein